MQRVFILIFSLTLSLMATAQKAVVIDDTKEHASIFDSGDPFSFISVVQKNAYYLGYMELEGMSQETFENLPEEAKVNVSRYTGRPGTAPLKDDDPNSPTFGEYLMHTDPATGQQSFIYDAPDTLYTLLDAIDRLVIEFEEGVGNIQERATRMHFYQKINGSFQSVLSVNAKDLLSFDGFSYFRELEPEMASEVLSDDPNSMWNTMRNEAIKQKEMYDGSKFSKWRYDLKLHHFPADAIRFGYFQLGEYPAKFDIWEAEREIYFSDLSEKSDAALYPFGLNLGSGIVGDTIGRTELLAGFEGVYSDYEISKTPMKDKDPYSPNFGKELVVENEDGTTSLKYPDPKEVFFWLDYSNPKIFIKESFHNNEKSNESTVDVVYFTINVKGSEEVISVMPFNEAIQGYFPGYQKLTLEEMAFYKALDKVLNNKKFVFDLSDVSVREQLNMK